MPFAKNWVHQCLLGSYVLFWVAMAIEPLHRSDWLLENLLVFAAVGFLVGTYRRFPLSNLSYTLITIFMFLHTYGSHYTYAEAPVEWLNRLVGDPARNNYDRLVHLAYGVLITYPVWEGVRRLARVDGRWAALFAVSLMVATGAVYELIEMWAALIVAPELGDAFLGTQGDIWDAQKDIALAMYGAVAAMTLTTALRGRQALLR